MDDEQEPREKSHPVMLRLPADMLRRMRVIARKRTIPVATLIRQLAMERLDQIEERRDDER